MPFTPIMIDFTRYRMPVQRAHGAVTGGLLPLAFDGIITERDTVFAAEPDRAELPPVPA
jgi:hypothetical protein